MDRLYDDVQRRSSSSSSTLGVGVADVSGEVGGRSSDDSDEEEEEDDDQGVGSEAQEEKEEDEDADSGCPFRDSPLYRSVYVYPHPNEPHYWVDSIRSSAGGKSNNGTVDWPWLAIDDRIRRDETSGHSHYEVKSNMAQFALGIIVREIFVHPKSCLRTDDPETAKLFYVPYLSSVHFHDGKMFPPNERYETSDHAQAVFDAIEGKYDRWEDHFGLTSKYWMRNGGADHVLVHSEPLHGLSHPRGWRGSRHFIGSQKQLRPPISVSVELSTTFVKMYPKCSAKNVLMPYPNPDGRWFNGKLDREVAQLLKSRKLDDVAKSDAALPQEKKAAGIGKGGGDDATNLPAPLDAPRPLGQYYSAGPHGECKKLRIAMNQDYRCSPSKKAMDALGGKRGLPYPLGMRAATFCPCPGGDSPSAKRMFDAVLAGCVPVILSEDFVWPLSKEFDPTMSSFDPNDFALRFSAKDHDVNKFDDKCSRIDPKRNDTGVQAALESISAEEIRRLRKGLEAARNRYSFYRYDESLVDNPLKERWLPDGGASMALVDALAARAGGVRWKDCEEELKLPRGSDPFRNKC